MSDFQVDYDKTDKPELDKVLKDYYQILIPDFYDITRTKPNGFEVGCKFQIHGMDKIVLLANGELHGIEEKIRFPRFTQWGEPIYYSDILIEHKSNTSNGKYGWVDAPYWCKWFTYYNMPIGKIYVFLWTELQSAWKKNELSWIVKYGTKVADNGNYDTLNTPVPEDVILPLCPSTLVYPSTPAEELKAIKEKEYLDKLEAERVERVTKHEREMREYLEKLNNKSNG